MGEAEDALRARRAEQQRKARAEAEQHARRQAEQQASRQRRAAEALARLETEIAAALRRIKAAGYAGGELYEFEEPGGLLFWRSRTTSLAMWTICEESTRESHSVPRDDSAWYVTKTTRYLLASTGELWIQRNQGEPQRSYDSTTYGYGVSHAIVGTPEPIHDWESLRPEVVDRILAGLRKL
jgi:hypothetical protein